MINQPIWKRKETALLLGALVGGTIAIIWVIHFIIQSMNDTASTMYEINQKTKRSDIKESPSVQQKMDALLGGTSDGKSSYEYKMRISSKVEIKDYTAAIKICEAGLKDHPKDPQLLLLRAQIHLGGLNDEQACMQDLNEMISDDPKDVRTRDWRGILKCRQHKLDEAYDDFSVAYARAPYLPMNSWNMGLIEVIRGNYEQSLPYLDKAISQKRTGELLYYRGYAISHLGRNELAKSDYSKATSLGFNPSLNDFQRSKEYPQTFIKELEELVPELRSSSKNQVRHS